MNAIKTIGAVSFALLAGAIAPAHADSVDRHASWEAFDQQRRSDRRDDDYRSGRGHWERKNFRDRRPVVVERTVVRPARVVERKVVVERRVIVERPVVVERPVYVDRPVIVEQPPYRHARDRYAYPPSYGYEQGGYAYPPAQRYERNPALGAVGGAILGAVIGNQVAAPQHRGAATAAGAVLGGVLGSHF